MCEKNYQHPGIEYSDRDREHTPAMRSLKWAIEKEVRELKLHKDGINLVYCAHTSDRLKEHEIEIQEQRGKYSLFVDNKNLYTTDNLDACVSWAKAAGHMDKSEKVTGTRSVVPKSAIRPKPVTLPKRKVTPNNAAADKLTKFMSWKAPAKSRHGWR